MTNANTYNAPAALDQNFRIDDVNSDEGYLYVDMPGRASIVIQVTYEGIIIDVFDAKVQNASAATCAVTWDEINDSDEIV